MTLQCEDAIIIGKRKILLVLIKRFSGDSCERFPDFEKKLIFFCFLLDTSRGTSQFSKFISKGYELFQTKALAWNDRNTG